ncbi:MAG: nuclear transport factor 2 family protein [Cyclobacteriaceae bacterium]|nr:nuclear transport factor 2 family protein [Cyclobacteriaceae bacterium]
MKYLFLCWLLLYSGFTWAQSEQQLLEFEKQIESAVVAAEIPFLQKAYADDFRFKHGTGHIDSKVSWLKDVEKNKGKFVSRVVEQAEAELHGDIGITQGTLQVTRTDTSYKVNYVRVYRRVGATWELFMHRTVQQENFK